MNDELFENIFRAVQSCPPERLPRLLGMLREIESVAQSRLSAPAPGPAAGQDVLLNVREAAQKLHCSTATLYKKDFPFTKRLGAKRLFSSAGIDAFLAKQK
jgi:predicted DNA-binding transcriptional regulator AlpA